MSARPEVRLECGCYGEQRSDGHIRILASAFLCPERHNCFDWVATDNALVESETYNESEAAVLRPPTPEGGAGGR